jgi:hypothetical protein
MGAIAICPHRSDVAANLETTNQEGRGGNAVGCFGW